MSPITERQATTTRTVLLSALLLLVITLTGTSLFIVWHRMRQQRFADFNLELNHSALSLNKVEAERLSALVSEADLLADLPSLKALMTTNDNRTIADGALEFWRTSGKDLFALANPDLRVRVVYARNLPQRELFRTDLTSTLQAHGSQYFLSDGHLFRFATAPVYFGNAESGTLLGYVVNGYAVDSAYLSKSSGLAEANLAFVSNGKVLANSIALPSTDSAIGLGHMTSAQAKLLLINGERYLAISRNVKAQSPNPLSIVLFKSLRTPEAEIHEISRLLVVTGLCIVCVGSLFMMFVARGLTQPLENLARRVRAFGSGELEVNAPLEGTREVRQLAVDFAVMQDRIEQSNQARLENARLATIGSMASSVSHDLRHYLASIYANAEFMAATDTSERERSEFLEDIRFAVMGTTEMLESLMIIGRTGSPVCHAPERLDVITRQAVTQVQMHPEAVNVTISFTTDNGDASVTADGKQLERAIYNLLLNACQAARSGAEEPLVNTAVIQVSGGVVVRVTDNGGGVVPAVQNTLFDPFVSQGKQNGTGLGLTLCRCIVEEHEGEVALVKSRPGETVFEIRIPGIGDDPVGRNETATKLQPGGSR